MSKVKLESLTDTFETIIKDKCNEFPLWKIGVYFTNVVEYPSGRQGECIEEVFNDILQGESTKYNTDIRDMIDGKEVVNKNDFILPNNVPVQFKTVVRRGGSIFNKQGDVVYGCKVKIFDTSRNKFNSDQLSVLRDKLKEIKHDLNVMLYVYDNHNNKGCLCLTSLREMSSYLFKGGGKKNVEKLFSYTSGGSHYFIDAGDVYHTSKKKGRVIYFEPPNDNVKEGYLFDVSKPTPYIDKVFYNK
jgi:hypothetical protein